MSIVSRAIHTSGQRYSIDGRRVGSIKTSLPSALVDLRSVDIHLGDIKKKQDDVERNIVLFQGATQFRKAMRNFVESPFFTTSIMTVILTNTLMLVLSTWGSVELQLNYYFTVLDGIFMAIYVIECALKMYVWRIYYFRQGWDILDLIIVGTSLSEMIAPLTIGPGTLTGGGASIFRILRVLRALRSLRVLRTIRFLENIQVILITCLHSFQSLGAIMMLMTTFLVIFAVIGRGLFATQDEKHFGDFAKTAFTLIQLLTLDDWYEIFTGMADMLGYFDVRMFFYLLLYIIIEYFVFLNLFIAVLVDNFQLTLRDKLIRKSEERERIENEKKQRKQMTLENDDFDIMEDEDDIENIQKELLSDEVSSSDDESPNVEKELEMFMDNATKEELDVTQWYYRILPALEKQLHRHHNYLSCHDRLINLAIDNTSDVLERR